jgi:predicted transcriptional regulator
MAANAQNDIQLLADPENHSVLEEVPSHPLTREELANRLSLSESAVGRRLSDFVDRDWVAHPDGGFRITTVGRFALREYDRCQSSVEAEYEEVDVDEESAELIDYLADSPKQACVLFALREGPARQNELITRSSVSRSTVVRATDAFQDRDLVREDASTGGFALTDTGEQILAAYDDLERAIEIINESKSFLLLLRANGLDIPIEVLGAAQVMVASREEPHTAVVRFMERMAEESPSGFRSMSPVVSGVYNQTIEPFVPTGMDMELILDKSALALSASDFSDDHTALTAGNIDLYVHPSGIPFALMIIDERRGMLGAFDEEGNHRGSLAGTNGTLVEWMGTVYEQYKREARHISEIDIESIGGANPRENGYYGDEAAQKEDR